MGAEVISLCEYRKKRQDERRSKSVNDNALPINHVPFPDMFGFDMFNLFSALPFERTILTGIDDPTDKPEE